MLFPSYLQYNTSFYYLILLFLSIQAIDAKSISLTSKQKTQLPFSAAFIENYDMDKALDQTSTSVSQSDIQRACTVFCYGPLLEAVQLYSVFNDSKTFVDMPMNKDPEDILELFSQLEKPYSPEQLLKFVEDNFYSEESDLLAWKPIDTVSSPKFIAKITNDDYKQWALDLNQMWPELARIMSPISLAAPQRHSLLERRFPFIVPGGRFRESYYWDTYWIVKGLLICEMHLTATGVVQNLLDDVQNFGFVPNGGRIYYLNRSQPPLLSDMVLEVFEATQDKYWLKKALKTLDKEYFYWMNPENGKVVQFSDGSILNRYYANTTSPRPESYLSDTITASLSPYPKNVTYRQLSSGAETGWDYSSRWINGPNINNLNLTDIITTNIIPIDLNSILYRLETNLARMHEYFDEGLDSMPPSDYKHFKSTIAQQYAQAAENRKNSINKWLWDSLSSSWKDFNLQTQTLSTRNSIANYVTPIWAGILDSNKTSLVVQTLLSSDLIQIGGALTTDLETGQQWDAPNVWPPLMSMLIDAMEFVSEHTIALELTTNWLESNFLGWETHGYMFEKYNGFEPGTIGSGGEYDPQFGFGWTNGVVFHLLNKYGNQI